MRRLPPLNALRSFEAAARHGSFNQAAEELFVTPSAISHQIKSLEEFLDLKLFQRNKRRVDLTAAGEKYLPSIQNALDEIDSATRRLVANPNSGAITLSVAPAFLTRWLMPRLTHFQEQYPDVELRLSASMGSVDFGHTDIDMAVQFGTGNWRGVDADFLLGMSVVPVCSPRLLNGRHPLKTVDDLRFQTLIQVSTRLDEWRAWLRSAGIDEVGFGKELRFSSTSLATGAAVEGLGIALADRHLVSKELRSGALVVPFDIALDTHSAFYLVKPDNRPLNASMSIFRDWILKEIQDSEEEDADFFRLA
ncbi:transcriptional regulator GcvA [Motiliproteus sp. MSK22-1]|uniref:transcriptional regulator GcvA n=1 Tax=Motiliproteus sp. MSK22-1 TaxID=1897630 RepID=UPI000975E63C|nr:transcriptional regulator GcvA [Motiliproteus sp. MSK22-1]OMH30075.1 transcriptional regulator [Motiliproteus sp. MSK22-1]